LNSGIDPKISIADVEIEKINKEDMESGVPGSGLGDIKDAQTQPDPDLYLSTSVERWYLAAFFWIMIVCGWSDGTTYVDVVLLYPTIPTTW
jgi:hypothetical protein